VKGGERNWAWGEKNEIGEQGWGNSAYEKCKGIKGIFMG
jgi:hypothetical protein